MQSIKQIVHDIADHLSEHATFDDVMYEIYVRQKVERSLKRPRQAR